MMPEVRIVRNSIYSFEHFFDMFIVMDTTTIAATSSVSMVEFHYKFMKGLHLDVYAPCLRLD